MYNPRTQRRRTATRVARAVGRVAGRAYRAVRSYQPSRGFKMVVNTAAAGAFAKPVYKAGRKAYKKYIQQSDPAAAGNELTKFQATIGKQPRLNNSRLLNLLKVGMVSNVYRAQGLTNFDTNVGYYALANRGTTDGVQPIAVPIHAWELTSFPNSDAGNGPGICFNWTDPNATADVTKLTLPIQNPGNTATVQTWQPEVSSGDTEANTFPYANKALHDWADIRLNLYGARKRGTTFKIDIVRITDVTASFQYAAGSNFAFKDLIRHLQSNLVYSNLQSYKSKAAKYYKIIKSYKFYVPGGSLDDLDTIGKVKEVKLFWKNGKVYDMGWRSLGITSESLPHTQADGADYTDRQGPDNAPHPNTRVYMVISAFSPERRTNTAVGWGANGMNMADADPLTEPSYDMVIRNKWSIAT